MGRRWIGIDITKVAIDVIRQRVETQHGRVDYVLRGEPGTIDEAHALAQLDKHEFQSWVLRRLGLPDTVKKGADAESTVASWGSLTMVTGGKASSRSRAAS